MRSSAKKFRNVRERIAIEMLATVEHRSTESQEAYLRVHEARNLLFLLLHEAAELHDIDLLLDIERTFLQLELEVIAHANENINALQAGIRQIDKVIQMLGYVRSPDEYRLSGIFYSLSEDLAGSTDLPKDAAHKFFASHQARIRNMTSGSDHQNKTALLHARSDNMALAKELYMELQRRALAAPEVRKSAKLYRVDRQHKIAA